MALIPPLNYLLIIHGPVYGTQNAYSAYRFACALIDRGHHINSLFFYQDGVSNGTALLAPASDEFNLHNAWCQLACQHKIPLQTCIAAGLRRGIVNAEEATDLALPATNLDPAFEMTGLGQLAEAMLTADRVIQF